MSDLVRHALRELKMAGLLEQDGMESEIGKDVLGLIVAFSKQEHSGWSASVCASLFGKIANYDILTPLTGYEDEWKDVTEFFLSSGKKEHTLYKNVYQNIRYSSVMKYVYKDGSEKTIDTCAIVFEDETGARYTSSNSAVEITMPYMPTKITKKETDKNE